MTPVNKAFLNAFQSVELAVKTAGYDSILSYENELKAKEEKTGKHNSDTSSLTISRQLRNYLVHEGDTSVEELTVFLNNLAGSISNAELPIKKFVCKSFVTEDMKVQDALGLLLKRKINKNVPVVNKTGQVTGNISYEEVCAYLSKNNITSATKVKALMNTKNIGKMFTNVKEDVHMSSINDNKSYVVSNAKGQLIGWY